MFTKPRLLASAVLLGLALLIPQTSLPARAQPRSPGFDRPVATLRGPATHRIELAATRLPNGQLAYKMLRYTLELGRGEPVDITDRYNPEASIPGPVIIMNEGDTAFVTLHNQIGEDRVSIHVHGVHYDIRSDGTLKVLNGVADEAATPERPYTYKWVAARGTAGVWPYHDHTFGGVNGAEDRGLFGALIVYPADRTTRAMVDGRIRNVPLTAVEKEFVLYMFGSTFYGVEIDHQAGGKVTPLWINPTMHAKLGSLVRFHVLGLGSEFHTFHLHAHRWLETGGTSPDTVIDTRNIGPLSRHSFLVRAGEGVGPGDWQYHCHVMQHMLSGMMGTFRVSETGGPSLPGPAPVASPAAS